MSAFIPEDYEPVEERIRKFYADHPQGRIITDLSLIHISEPTRPY